MKNKEAISESIFSPKRYLLWLVIILAIFILDYAVKRWVIYSVSIFQVINVTSYFDLVRLHNEGAAFSFLSNASGWQRWFFIIVGSVAIVWFLIWLKDAIKQGNYLLAIALTMIIGGALGNTCDRIIYGYVVDYLSFYYQDWRYPAFNVADTFITLGAMFFILNEVKEFRLKS